MIGLLGGNFHLCSNFKRNFCLQTVENLIRRPVLWRLIWFFTVCLCSTKRTLGAFVNELFYIFIILHFVLSMFIIDLCRMKNAHFDRYIALWQFNLF